MVIALAYNDNKTQIFFKAAIARLEALENDYTGMETVETVDDDEASLEDDGIRLKRMSFDVLKACNVFCVWCWQEICKPAQQPGLMATGIYATKSCLMTLVFAATITVHSVHHDHVNEIPAGS
ncbi:hypothetical protein DKX38_010457 [Salix brachista]|uniref:Uncharacterized protein n=1 Tax=Salix brachista TaxID=2182728 RepID=A0A5N5MG98_9ROSI|nr:hypothetical protein DKX38_010457 [Salix brachista]